MSRGFRPRYHMGEDWNGLEGGNSDRGKPVYSTGNGIVVLARDMRMSWGNLVIIRHIFLEDRQMKTVDSVYAHLDKILVREGKQIVRGQQIGTIGTNRGMYTAHLHFEVRKNLYIGFNQRAFGKDYSNYYVPTSFIAQRRKLYGAGRSALVAVNTFNLEGKGAPPLEESPLRAQTKETRSLPSAPAVVPPKKKEPLKGAPPLEESPLRAQTKETRSFPSAPAVVPPKKKEPSKGAPPLDEPSLRAQTKAARNLASAPASEREHNDTNNHPTKAARNLPSAPAAVPSKKKEQFRVDRFGDLFSN
jgi:hypothetical protein